LLHWQFLGGIFNQWARPKGLWLNTREMVTKPASTPPNALGSWSTCDFIKFRKLLILTTSEASQVPPIGKGGFLEGL